MADSKFSPRARISTLEISWAAGFIEGEGSFANAGSPQVMAAQVQRQPLERLLRLFGGSIWQRSTKGFSTKPIWCWAVSGTRAAQVMMTLYCLMSDRRKDQIAAALDAWKLQTRILRTKNSDICLFGHPLVGGNIVRVGKYIRCRTCRNATRRKYRRRLAEEKRQFICEAA